MAVHTHPQSGTPLEGIRLPVGAILQRDDRYASSDGKWRVCAHTVGHEIRPGCVTVWIRKPKPLSDDAVDLLACLLSANERQKTACIAERDGAFYLVPRPSFSWDGRLDFYSWRVNCPRCVQELLEYGYLERSSHPTSGWNADYSTVAPGHMNVVYLLTEEARQNGPTIAGAPPSTH